MARYALYYAGFNVENGIEQIGVALSEDLHTWLRPRTEPCIAIGSSGEADALQTSNPCVLKENGRYRMWYQGKSSSGILSVCYAESMDGVTWSAHPNAVLSPMGIEPEYRAGYQQPHVVHDSEQGIYRMWFAIQEGGKSRFAYAESKDGLSWHIRHDRILEPTESWEGDFLYYPFVTKESDGYVMWYTGRAPGFTWNIGRATSADGITWKKDTDNPRGPHASLSAPVRAAGNFLGKKLPLPGLDALHGAGSPFVYKEGETFFMLTHAAGPRGKLSIVLYESNDGKKWKIRSRSILKEGKGSWDQYFQADPYLLVV
jgi:predicted GH43/DUF377 family glycosyl hydrolase